MPQNSLTSNLQDFPHSQDAVKYCENVVSGVLPNCKFIILACQQFLDLFENQDGWFYDPSKADKVCNFIELLPHVKGRWANKKEMLILEPWQKFILCAIFGWVDEDGFRKHHYMYLKIPRKNGKSMLAAAIGLYMFVADGEYGAEVYSGATTEDQAWKVFSPAKIMAERADGFQEFYDFDINAKTLIRMEDNSKFAPIIGNPGDGASPSCAIHDEYHEHADSKQVSTMSTGMGSREQPIQLIITTAGVTIGGPCHEDERAAEKTIQGINGKDDRQLSIMYGIDPDDHWTDPDNLKKANPNYDVSISGEFLLHALQKAISQSKEQSDFRTKHLNEWVGARNPWMNILAWQALNKPDKFEEFRYMSAHGAVDIASRKDVACVCLTWKKGDEYYTKQWFFVPELALESNDKYKELQHSGFLIVTPGNKTDQAFIERKILDLHKEFRVSSWAFDDWQGDYMMTRCEEEGLEVVNYGQNVKNMSAPMKEVEGEVLDKKLFHDGNDIMTWMMGNVSCKKDAKDNIYPRKENDNDPRCKIDGPVALIMSMGRWMADDSGGNFDDFLENPLVI